MKSGCIVPISLQHLCEENEIQGQGNCFDMSYFLRTFLTPSDGCSSRKIRAAHGLIIDLL